MSIAFLNRPSSFPVPDKTYNPFEALFDSEKKTVSFLDTNTHEGVVGRTSWNVDDKTIISPSIDERYANKLYEIMNDADQPILQIKGWGSGMTVEDYKSLPQHNQDPTDVDFVKAVETLVDEHLPTTEVWLQWDGDKLTLGTYGYFLIAVAHILSSRRLLSGLVSMKLTTSEKVEGEGGYAFANQFMQLNGGAMLRRACPGVPICIVAYSLEKTELIMSMQKQTGHGFYGACLNRLFAGPKTIFAFGGGAVLTSEEEYKYLPNTTIKGFKITRKGGKEKSKFVKKHKPTSKPSVARQYMDPL
jgi:hypothetical protein